MWRRRRLARASHAGKLRWPRAARKAAAGLVTVAALAVSPEFVPPAAAQEFEECDGLLARGWRGLLLPDNSADPGYCGPVYSIPAMMGNNEGPFASVIDISSFPSVPIFATYTGATAAFVNINQPVTFSFTSANPNPILPNIAGATSVPPAIDRSGDGQPGTFRGLPEVGGVTAVVAANTPFPGTVAFQSGQAVFVTNTSPLFQSQSVGTDPSVLLPEVDGSVAAAEADPNFNGYQLQYFYLFSREAFHLAIPNPTSTSLTGRTKIAQNGSVVPRTRVFLDYGFTHDDDIPGDFTFHRFVPGMERTFFSGLTSLELRVPVASTADSSILADNTFSEGNSQFGNVSLAVKGLMIRVPRFAFSGGLQFTFPTADDTSVTLADGTQVLDVDNESVHIMPFLGGVYDGNLFYSQAFAQIDMDANGNSLRVNPTLTPGAALVRAPDLYDDDRLYLDWATGLWLYRAPGGPRGPLDVVAFAPTVEAHYTQGFGDPNIVRAGSLTIGEPADRISRLDVLVGLTGVLQGGTFSAGFGGPVSGGDNQHDWELRFLFNHALR